MEDHSCDRLSVVWLGKYSEGNYDYVQSVFTYVFSLLPFIYPNSLLLSFLTTLVKFTITWLNILLKAFAILTNVKMVFMRLCIQLILLSPFTSVTCFSNFLKNALRQSSTRCPISILLVRLMIMLMEDRLANNLPSKIQKEQAITLTICAISLPTSLLSQEDNFYVKSKYICILHVYYIHNKLSIIVLDHHSDFFGANTRPDASCCEITTATKGLEMFG